jgi:thymidylate synthase
MTYSIARVSDIRSKFGELLQRQVFTGVNREGAMTSLVGSTTIEIVGANFIADKTTIFGDVNWEYVRREDEWYHSMSLNVNDIPGGPPAIWKAVADKDGFINSNYGWCIHSSENGFMENIAEPDHDYGCRLHQRPVIESSQFEQVYLELKKNPDSRRATMIYTRPSMWLDYNKNGRSDFMCTNAVGYLIRDGVLHAHVQMRSNDAWAGYRNDRAWQSHVQLKLATELGVEVGAIHWSVTSLHVYARNYYLVDYYNRTGNVHISKAEYQELYPDSPYSSL